MDVLRRAVYRVQRRHLIDSYEAGHWVIVLVCCIVLVTGLLWSRDFVYLLKDARVKSHDTSMPCLHATWEATVDISAKNMV